MFKKVMEYTKQFHMIERGDRIVVGVSGGADSVCLLYVLHKLIPVYSMELIAVHINHGIRGEEANRDQLYVSELCKSLGIPFFHFTYNVKEFAERCNLTEEEAGRNIRYQSFLEVCRQQKCNKIAVAHNKNDNAETILFHLFRGSGIKGLTGMEPNRVICTDFGNIILIRPLLCMERDEIEEYLHREGISYQIDSTNLTEDYTRNKIRNRILRYATKEINTGAVNNIHESSLKLKEALEYMEENINSRYRELVTKKGSEFTIKVKELSKEAMALQKGIIRKVLEEIAGRQKDLESKHIDAIRSLYDKQVGKYVHLPYHMIAKRDYEEIKIYKKNEVRTINSGDTKIEAKIIGIPGELYVPQLNKVLQTQLLQYEKKNTIPKNSCMKWFDYDKIENAVEIRTRKEGDYIQINGSGGRKKIKDFFIDQKIPKEQRDSQVLIADGNHVMWIPGTSDRMSEKYKVDETTTKILLMKMIDLEESKDDR